MDLERYLGLGLLGLCVGIVGTMIGAGGGFILMPILLLLYPQDPPAQLASMSLAVVALNAISGSIGYARQRLIDYRAGAIFSIAAVPGAIAGALVTGALARRWFDALLGATLIVAAIALVAGTRRAALDRHNAVGPRPPRTEFSVSRGVGWSAFVGFISSLLGIGGGILHVPILVTLLRFPVHVAAATSHFVLAITAAAGTGVHVATGSLDHGWRRTIAISVGVVLGAQIGAVLAPRARGTLIVRGLAIALGLVGVRLLWMWASHGPSPSLPSP